MRLLTLLPSNYGRAIKPVRVTLVTVASRLGSTAQLPDPCKPYETVNRFSNRIFHPFQWMKARMTQITFARDAYLECADSLRLAPSQCQLGDTFQSWFAVTTLHMWMLHARLRGEGEMGRQMYSGMVEHFWVDTEKKLHDAGVKHRVSSIMKELVDFFHGAGLAYDEGIHYDDRVLATALWRNVFNGSPNTLPSQVYPLLEHTRYQLQRLENLPRSDLLVGKFKFSDDFLHGGVERVAKNLSKDPAAST